MRKLINNGVISDDSWTLLESIETDSELPQGKVIVPLAYWLENRAALQAKGNDIGVWLDGHDDVTPLRENAKHLPLIAVNFPAFMDGRGFSAGRLIRERLGFTGELRAIGNFMRDQLCYLRRCGFSAFSLPENITAEGALQSLNDFSEAYQAAVDQPTPLFRRRS